MVDDSQATSPTSAPQARRGRVAVIVGLVVVYLGVVTLNAWVAEDAYIAFRTVDNAINGFGLRWNPAERVQTYTCPLWVLVLCGVGAITREMYGTSLALCGACSVAATGLVASATRGQLSKAAACLLCLTCSKAFVDYSTSAMENPLSHLFIGCFLQIVFWQSTGVTGAQRIQQRRLFGLSLFASLVTLNRPDAILLCLPILWIEVLQFGSIRRSMLPIALGSLPFVLWETFSIIYYGFPFPNTAYAKLGHGITRTEVLQQGGHYFLNSLRIDPITLLAIVLGMLVLMNAFRTQTGMQDASGKRIGAIVAGVAAYLLYIVWIGGDYMSGRFFSLPFYAVVLTVALSPLRIPSGVWWWLSLFVVVNGSLLPHSPLTNWRVETDRRWEELVDEHGIADERTVYAPYLALFGTRREQFVAELSNPPRNPMRAVSQVKDFEFHNQFFGRYFLLLGQRDRAVANEVPVRVTVNAGIRCHVGGPEVHYLDVMGICDPLLARLPAYETEEWRIGHFQRVLPAGYNECLLRLQSHPGDVEAALRQFRDPQLAAYYQQLHLITRGKLLTSQRLWAILQLNLGISAARIDFAQYRQPQLKAWTGPGGSDRFQDVFTTQE